MMFLSHRSVSTFNLLNKALTIHHGDQGFRVDDITAHVGILRWTSRRPFIPVTCFLGRRHFHNVGKEEQINFWTKNSLLHPKGAMCESKANNYRQSWGKWWYPWDGTLNNQPHHIHLMSQQQWVFRKVVLVAALELCGYQQQKALNQVLLLYRWDLSLLVGTSNEILSHGHSKGALMWHHRAGEPFEAAYVMPSRPHMLFLVQTYSRWSWTLHLLLPDTSYINLNDKMYTVCLKKLLRYAPACGPLEGPCSKLSHM